MALFSIFRTIVHVWRLFPSIAEGYALLWREGMHPVWKIICCSRSSLLLWKLNIHHNHHKSLSSDSVLSQFNSVLLLTSCFIVMQCSIFLPFTSSSSQLPLSCIHFLFLLCMLQIWKTHSACNFYYRKCLGNTTSRFQNCATIKVWPLSCFIWGE
jgi:hypothetical protein